MKITHPFKVVGLMLAVGVLSACATTMMRSVEPDPSFHSSQIRRVLVINMSKDPQRRVQVEDEFVRQWKSHGDVEAAASHSVLPPGTKLEKGPIAAFARAQKYDTVLVTRLTGSEKVNREYPGDNFESNSSSGTADMEQPLVASPAYADAYRMAAVTTRVYETATEKRIWTGSTQILVAEDPQKLIKPFVKVVLETLYKTP